MALVPQNYDRNLRSPKFYSTVNSGRQEFNPDIIMSYNNADELLQVEEIWRGTKWTQTISGSNYANHTISYTVTYRAWEETTVS